MLWINGIKLPSPSEYSIDEMDIMKAERTQTGDAVIDYITTKRKISYAKNVVTKAEQSLIMSLVGNVNGPLTVQYIDINTGDIKTGSFYSGDRGATCIMFKNGIPTWQGLKFNLIER